MAFIASRHEILKGGDLKGRNMCMCHRSEHCGNRNKN